MEDWVQPASRGELPRREVMQTPDEVAAAAGTNGYEVLTSLGRRFHRIYRPA